MFWCRSLMASFFEDIVRAFLCSAWLFCGAGIFDCVEQHMPDKFPVLSLADFPLHVFFVKIYFSSRYSGGSRILVWKAWARRVEVTLFRIEARNFHSGGFDFLHVHFDVEIERFDVLRLVVKCPCLGQSDFRWLWNRVRIFCFRSFPKPYYQVSDASTAWCFSDVPLFWSLRIRFPMFPQPEDHISDVSSS